MILALRTDKPEAELYLVDDDGREIAHHSWEAHRQLAATLLATANKFLAENSTSTKEIAGIIVFSGEGSFTGLRIGAAVANALAYAHQAPIVAGEGEAWLKDGIAKIRNAKPGDFVVPTYDREPNITKPNS